MPDGFIIIDKPRGVTSQSVDRSIRRHFGVKRVGHAGTLDPFAGGVLPIALGRATKFIDFLSDQKSYRAEIFFGRSTDTADCTGRTLELLDDFSMPDAARLDAALQTFVGEIEQTPPKFSAIKLDGRKAYELARRSIDFEVPTRIVTIDRIDLISIDGRSVVIDVDCRKGTYIRSLAVDIGRALGLPTMLNALRRTRSSCFTLERSISIESIENLRAESIIPIEQCLMHLPSIELKLNRRRAFINGLSTTIGSPNVERIRVNCGGEFLGLGSIVGGELKAIKLFTLE